MERIERLLTARQRDGLLRRLRPAERRRTGKVYREAKEYFDFSSNDYLGLAGHERLKKASCQAVELLGTSASASRLLSGDLEIFHRLEEQVANFKGKESALVFNSGYQANTGIISALCGRASAVFCDRLSHASIIDGVRQSGAKLFRFEHNDANYLEGLLRKEGGKFENCLIVTETIFSMDGDKAPLKEIVDIKERYNCLLMVDEAHATGVFGYSGSGMAEQEGLAEKIDLIMGTFGKALGGFGAYLACSEAVKQYLINFSRSFIYSTALPPGVIAANIEALNVVRDEPERRKTLLANAAYFRSRLEGAGLEVKGDSQIVPVIVGESDRAAELSRELEGSGYWVLAIRPPTVPAGQARLRFSLCYDHGREVLEKLAEKVIGLF